MKLLSNMQNIHAGRPAAILGGGVSLRDDLANIPDTALNADYQKLSLNPVLFAVNDHAFHKNIQPEYMVFFDDPHIKPELLRLATAEPRNYQRVTDLMEYTDIDLRGVSRPSARSGIFAAWLAMYLGCAPIFLCGMDLYTAPVKYCHDKDSFMGEKNIFKEPLEKHLKDWSTLKRYPNAKQIRAMSGPLVGVFGRNDL
jgi:hypothetical protein